MTKATLCIGISNYPGTDSGLSGCVNDADDRTASLSACAFETRRLAGREDQLPDDIRLLFATQCVVRKHGQAPAPITLFADTATFRRARCAPVQGVRMTPLPSTH